MSKKLIIKTSLNLGVSQAEASRIIKGVIDAVKETAAEDGSISIQNFGSFNVKHIEKKSKLHNVVYDVNKNIVRFKIGAGFSRLINQ